MFYYVAASAATINNDTALFFDGSTYHSYFSGISKKCVRPIFSSNIGDIVGLVFLPPYLYSQSYVHIQKSTFRKNLALNVLSSLSYFVN